MLGFEARRARARRADNAPRCAPTPVGSMGGWRACWALCALRQKITRYDGRARRERKKKNRRTTARRRRGSRCQHVRRENEAPAGRAPPLNSERMPGRADKEPGVRDPASRVSATAGHQERAAIASRIYRARARVTSAASLFFSFAFFSPGQNPTRPSRETLNGKLLDSASLPLAENAVKSLKKNV